MASKIDKMMNDESVEVGNALLSKQIDELSDLHRLAISCIISEGKRSAQIEQQLSSFLTENEQLRKEVENLKQSIRVKNYWLHYRCTSESCEGDGEKCLGLRDDTKPKPWDAELPISNWL